MGVFGRQSLYFDNLGSATDPTIHDDSSRGFEIGSTWFNTATGIFYRATNVTVGAAAWSVMTPGSQILGSIIGANMNVTTDQSFVMRINPLLESFAITRIIATNASIELDTAAGGIYPAAAKAGAAIVAAAQVYTALVVPSDLLTLTLAAGGSGKVLSVVPILSLTTPQGAAATADFYLFGDVLA